MWLAVVVALSTAADQANALSWFEDWRYLGDVTRIVILILVVMLLRTVSLSGDRLLAFWMARRQSHSFLRQAGKDYLADVGGTIALANSHRRSHVARTVAAGLGGFLGISRCPHEQAVENCRRAAQRAIETTRAEYRYGLATLAQIASVAPFIGLLGTVCGLFGAFGKSGAIGAVRAYVAETTSESLLPTAVALLAAIPALWAHNAFRDSLSAMELEMESASSELVGSLSWRRNRDSHLLRETYAEAALLYPENDPGTPYNWEIRADSQVFFLLPLWLPFFYCVYALVRAFYLSLRWYG